jgi:hypothetical protein
VSPDTYDEGKAELGLVGIVELMEAGIVGFAKPVEARAEQFLCLINI